MKTPNHWKNKNFISTILRPLGSVYATATALRLKMKKTQKVDVPVICVGNLTAGGTGKTPVAIALAQMLHDLGKNPFFVSRGYGGTLSGVIVDSRVHSAHEVGDEPLLLSREAPVSINADRFSAAGKAVENGAEVIIMDDGFQNPTLHKDVSFLVFDGGFGIGNGCPLPAGPLRESFKAGLQRADAAIIIGEDVTGLREKLGDMPVFEGTTVELPLPEISMPVIAFAGIGRPEKFYNSLRQAGVNVVKTFDFPDHHAYSEQELRDLIDMAWKEDCELFTTAKDFVKIPDELRHHFKVLEIAIEWKDKENLFRFLQDRIFPQSDENKTQITEDANEKPLD